MSLVDLLFKGPVNVMDLNHEQYGDAAVMRRQGLVVLEGDAIRLTKSGKDWVLEQILQQLKQKGLAEQFGSDWALTPEGRMIVKGGDRVL